MSSNLTATLVDTAITVAVAVIVLLCRRRLLAKIENEKKRDHLEKTLLICCPAIVAGCLLLATVKIAEREHPLDREVRALNAAMPRFLAEGERLDRVTRSGTNGLVFHVTFLKIRVADIDGAVWKDKVAPRIKQRMESNTEVQKAVRSHISVSYRYYDKDAALIGEVFVPSI